MPERACACCWQGSLCGLTVIHDAACQCRASSEAGTPLDELEVALDAMNSMQARFHYRYHLLSAVDRRVGGQGVVQFAAIVDTMDKVRQQLTLDANLPKAEGCSVMCELSFPR